MPGPGQPPAAAPAPSLPGYQLMERLGSGTYADVYRCVCGADRRQLALKCVHRSRLNRRATDNIVSEISLLKRLQHPNVVALHDFGCDKHYVYIVMELCSGGDLSQLIRSRRRLPESMVRQFLRQLGLAMQYLHSHSISHMDLKPQNLLLTSDSPPTLKVADFGFADYLMPDAETEGGLRGSPLYMAPEIVTKGVYSASADLWSIGVILYECLFGRAPYSSSTIEELLKKIKEDKPVELPPGVSISFDCRDLVTRLLQRSPQDRITFEDFFNHPFLDLEHAPCAESLAKGARVLERAVERDEAEDWEAAIRLYSDGVEHLFAAMQFEKSEQCRIALRRRLTDYIRRAEVLRARLRSAAPAGTAVTVRDSGDPTCSSDAEAAPLEALAARRESVRSALELVRSAVWYEREARWDIALDKYRLAIQEMMTPAEQACLHERRVLVATMNRWLSRAESIQSVRELQSELANPDGGGPSAPDGHKNSTCPARAGRPSLI
ncbi:Serine/threonine-protein kinase ULK3 [Amphibalanus amphitrite]|uniref:Serine/threonine-protein kinase ULK3 n=1 Tax=Amphibalanus amphitrite TaxID=1232801 RepID=A0A6A4X840_AMPAM|nr:Serine/threonine-protein kinase ULK3 [Amphibalanus amphitrite]KAF0310571.1 Serine/threonine-protein kinase ULK3 [Amphibalanus amphitrite]